jgi:hypothetical protein
MDQLDPTWVGDNSSCIANQQERDADVEDDRFNQVQGFKLEEKSLRGKG